MARYGRLAVAFNAAAKVAPAAGIFGVRQGFATYDQAIKMGLKGEEATRLGGYAGLIEGVTTIWRMREGFITARVVDSGEHEEGGGHAAGVVLRPHRGSHHRGLQRHPRCGLESIAAGSAREAFRRSLGESVRSAWKEGAKAFGKGVLGEIGEEELIAALDTAFVQTQIQPGMTGGQFMKRLYDTAVATAFASGCCS